MPFARFSFFLVLGLIFAGTTAKAGDKPELVFGIFPYVTPAQLMEFHSPLRDYIAKSLRRPVALVTAPDFQSFADRTQQGQYDLILTAPHMGRLAETRDGYKRLVQTGHTVQGIFLARKDSDIYQIEDLKGKRLMMAQPVSLFYQMADQLLRKKGLVPGESITIVETRTHNNAMTAPLRGEADASVTGFLLWQVLGQEHKDQLRVIATTDKQPGFVLMASKRISKQDMNKLMKVLMNFHRLSEGKAYLAATGYGSFKKIDDKTMKSLDPYTRVLQTSTGP
jgi:phosphonate transport system substrate-binding protein